MTRCLLVIYKNILTHIDLTSVHNKVVNKTKGPVSI